MVQEGFKQAGGQRLHYLRYGSGAQPVLAFHGYSNNAAMFAPLANHLGAAYALYSFDLPHHGHSKWPAGTLIQKDDLAELAHNISGQHSGARLLLSAFSLGGRACLSIVECAPELVAGMAMVAPDGLAYHPLYRFFVRSAAGRKLFGNFTGSPMRYLQLIDWLYRRRLIDNSRYHFAKYFVQTDAARTFLHNVWLDLRELMPDMATVRRNIHEVQIPATLLMGRHDRIIPPKLALNFAKGLSSVAVEVLEKGHRLMDDDTFRRIAAALQHSRP